MADPGQSLCPTFFLSFFVFFILRFLLHVIDYLYHRLESLTYLQVKGQGPRGVVGRSVRPSVSIR